MSQTQKTLDSKANSLSVNLRWKERGKKKAFIAKLITEAKSCPYCGIELNLKNVSLDHKTPFHSSAARRDLETHYKLDMPENLQITCRKCNKVKGNLNDKQFRSLLKFLSKDPQMKQSILKRLSQSNIIWRKH